jgi:hypothetical protein
MNRPATAVGPKRLSLLGGAGLVLFAVLVQLSVGPVHLVERTSIREDMKARLMAGLPHSELTVFHLTGAEFTNIDFEDDGREMEVDGVMYDIVRIHRGSANGVVVEAARDDAETKLMADLDRLVQGQLAGDTRGQEQRAQLVSAWCAFHEAIGRTSLRLPPPKELTYAASSECTGRTIGAIDPGPPRRA